MHLTRRVGLCHAHRSLRPQEAFSKVLTRPTHKEPLHMEDGMLPRLQPPWGILRSRSGVLPSSALHQTGGGLCGAHHVGLTGCVCLRSWRGLQSMLAAGH